MKPFWKDKDMKENVKVQNRGGSAAGIHYAEMYQACPRKFHLKFNLGIEEKYLDKALIFGSAIHEAKAVFYLTRGDEKKSIKRGLKECDDRKEEFISNDEYLFARGRVEPLMKAWFQTYGHSDIEKYNIVAVEEEIRIPVPFTPNFVHTQRHDAILEDKKTGAIYTFDTKTASSSLDFTLNSVRLSEQVTSYCWGGYEVFGKRHKGFIIDVQYWSTRSSNPHTIKCQRSEPIRKTEHELKAFQAHIAGLFNEIQTKQTALKQGTPSPFLYRKNSFYCMAFFRKCPFADICNLPDHVIPKRLPEHLIIKDELKHLDSLTFDNIYFGEGPY